MNNYGRQVSHPITSNPRAKECAIENCPYLRASSVCRCPLFIKKDDETITLPPPLPADPRLRYTEEHGYIDSVWFIVIIGITYLLFVFAIVGVIK